MAGGIKEAQKLDFFLKTDPLFASDYRKLVKMKKAGILKESGKELEELTRSAEERRIIFLEMAVERSEENAREKKDEKKESLKNKKKD